MREIYNISTVTSIEIPSVAKDQTSGKMGGFHVMTMLCTTGILRFLAKEIIPTIPQPLHSSDLAPCDFWPFPSLKVNDSL